MYHVEYNDLFKSLYPIGPGLILLKFNIIVKKFEEFFLAQRKWYDSIIL